MRIVVLYRPGSENARRTEEYMADFCRFHPDENLKPINIDSREGSNLAQIYGVMEQPTILALKDDGQMQQMWQGVNRMPLMNDLAYYAQQ